MKAAHAPAPAPARDDTSASLYLGRCAVAALYDELALDPKPGLVSFIDSGSHTDMDARTFMRSLFALRHYFPRIAQLGASGAPFDQIERVGVAAEARMLEVTGGINTHRGAIFSLGLLCASAGSLLTRGRPLTPASLQGALRAGWGDALAARAQRHALSNGQCAARRFGLRSAGDEAALGFPVLFDTAVPVLREALNQGFDVRHARVQTLFHIIATLADTNLAHRGGLEGLRFAQRAARDFLDAGGAARHDGLQHARELHRAFVARRLSPGGAADVLAAACWVHGVCKA
jgi:triphosphoribosyl-dephospho-CoA synthase